MPQKAQKAQRRMKTFCALVPFVANLMRLRRDPRCGLTPPALAQRADRGYPEPVPRPAREILDRLIGNRHCFCVTPTVGARR